jgi:NADPH2:quinone reductase
VSLPAIPGSEAAGTVVDIGADVAGIAAGDRVVSFGFKGSYAQLGIASAADVVKLPPHVSTRQGAAAMLQGMTAHYLAYDTYRLSENDTCLVHAAAGGVGLLLIQMAKHLGARVIGTTSSRDKAERARGAGADHVILYTEQDFADEARRITGGAGVQVVYDSVGRTTFDQSLRALARRGMLVLFGLSSGPVSPFEIQRLNQAGSLYLTRPKLQDYVATREALEARANAVLGMTGDGKLRARIHGEFPLAEAGEAHRALESRATSGKVLLIPEA